MYKAKEIEKIYWDIMEVSEIIEEVDSTVRFWSDFLEKEGFMKIKRNSNRKRYYTSDQLITLANFSVLSATGEYTLKGILKRLTPGARS